MKTIYLFFLIIILVGCSIEETENDIVEPPQTEQGSEEEGEGEEGSETSGTTLSLNIEGLELDFSDFSALSTMEVTPMDSDGSFGEIESINELPVIVTDANDELLFGYYPTLLESEEVGIADIVLFFISTYPDFANRDYDLAEIKNELAAIDYSVLSSELVKSLNQKENPYLNTNFLSSLRDYTSLLNNAFSEENNTRDSEGFFEISYTRDNRISFPQKSPLYSSIGVGFLSNEKNELYYELLSPREASSLIEGIKVFFFGEEDEVLNKFEGNLVHDGEWEVQISNGRHGNTDLDDLANHQNQKQISAIVLSYILPQALKAIDFEGPCKDILKEIADRILENMKSKLSDPNSNISSEFYEGIIKSSNEQLVAGYAACLTGEPILQKFLNTLSKWRSKILSVLTFGKDFSQLILIDRDFTNSIINKSDKLYLDKEKNLLFSTLSYENISETTFKGEPEDIFNYKAVVKEFWTKYEVKSTTARSDFNNVGIDKPGTDLPFKVEIITGDAVYPDGTLTNENGELNFNFGLNEEDSEFEIVPDFKNSNINNETLKISIDSTPKLFWKGSMSLTNSEDLVPCQVDRNNDGILDFGVDCGTGGCQSCTRALFGSSWGTSATIEYAFSNAITNNNFKVGATVGGTSTSYFVYCYTSNITANDDNFTVMINHYAPGGLSSADSKLQEVNFKIIERTSNSIKGTWSGEILAAEDHCLEACSGVWEVFSIEKFESVCNFLPSNP